jgi:3-hydroxyacyl-CoA dehydrogenase
MADKIAILGRGIIGRAWAIVFARAGFEVALTGRADVPADAALAAIDDSLADLEAAGLIASAAEARACIRPAASLAEALDGAALALENLPEERALKVAAFADMDARAGPDCVLASSTSGMPASTWAEDLAGRGRCLVAHPGNPPFLLPVVELVPAPFTEASAVERCRDLMAGAGMAPVVLAKEVPGFVFNRLQSAVINEAMGLIDGGYIGTADLDTVMKQGLGLRWSFMGPMESLALNADGGFRGAIDHFGGALKGIGPHLFTKGEWRDAVADRIHVDLLETFPDGDVKGRQRWRDRRLMALTTHKRETAASIGD